MNKQKQEKRAKLLSIIILWLGSGLYSWGTMMAYFINEQPVIDSHARTWSGICVLIAATGPYGIPVGIVLSNFNQYGWQLWEKP